MKTERLFTKRTLQHLYRRINPVPMQRNCVRGLRFNSQTGTFLGTTIIAALTKSRDKERQVN